MGALAPAGSLHAYNSLASPSLNPARERSSSSEPKGKKPSSLVISFNGVPRQESKKKNLGNNGLKYLQDIRPDSYAYGRLLQECTAMEGLAEGKGVHAHMIKTGFQMNMFIDNTLVNMYAKSGSLDYARQVFDKMSERNIVSWTAMITGYAQNWHGEEEALNLYRGMLGKGLKPNQFTFASVIKACASSAAMKGGKQIHTCVIKTGFEADVTMGNGLLTLYARCGSVEDARQVFDKMSQRDLVSWSAMVAGYAQNGHGEEALKLFTQMQRTGAKPDKFAYTTALAVCDSPEGLGWGKQVHAYILKSEFESDLLVESTLLTMYARCGSLENARQLFDKMPERDIVSWTVMIAGYAQSGLGEEALKLFCLMLRRGTMPDGFSFTSVLGVCADLASVEQGKQVHAHILKMGFESETSVGSGLVTTYAKCSAIESARQVFDKMPERDVVAWTAMIAGYALHGLGEDALQLFEEMQGKGVKPDGITFVAILCACSHAGLVEKGRGLFDSMSREYGIKPTMEHYACLVDQLGRAGLLGEAERIILEMPFAPGASVWGTLLAACRIHGNMEIGERVAERLLELEPQEAATYVLLSNTYAMAGRWDDVAKIRKMMKDRNVSKEPGRSWIEVKNKVHAFFADDRLHPQAEQIYARLEDLGRQMEEAGYVPQSPICAAGTGSEFRLLSRRFFEEAGFPHDASPPVVHPSSRGCITLSS